MVVAAVVVVAAVLVVIVVIVVLTVLVVLVAAVVVVVMLCCCCYCLLSDPKTIRTLINVLHHTQDPMFLDSGSLGTSKTICVTVIKPVFAHPQRLSQTTF